MCVFCQLKSVSQGSVARFVDVGVDSLASSIPGVFCWIVKGVCSGCVPGEYVSRQGSVVRFVDVGINSLASSIPGVF